MKSSYFPDANEKIREATAYIEAWLRADKDYKVVNVESIQKYKEMDIDLLLFKKIPKQLLKLFTLELKIDFKHKTGNFFCETISNCTTNSLGCWYKTESDYIMYYFPDLRTMYKIPTKKAQEWLRKHQNEFKVARTSTKGKNGEHWYYTEGVLVPIHKLVKELEIEVFEIELGDDEL